MWRAWRCPTGSENSREPQSASAKRKSISTLRIQAWNPGKMSRFFSLVWQMPAAPPQSSTKRLQPRRAVDPQPYVNHHGSSERPPFAASRFRWPQWNVAAGGDKEHRELTWPSPRRSVIREGFHGPFRGDREDETRRAARGAGHDRTHQRLDPEL